MEIDQSHWYVLDQHAMAIKITVQVYAVVAEYVYLKMYVFVHRHTTLQIVQLVLLLLLRQPQHRITYAITRRVLQHVVDMERATLMDSVLARQTIED